MHYSDSDIDGLFRSRLLCAAGLLLLSNRCSVMIMLDSHVGDD